MRKITLEFKYIFLHISCGVVLRLQIRFPLKYKQLGNRNIHLRLKLFQYIHLYCLKKVLNFTKGKGIQKYIQYRFTNNKWMPIMTWHKRNKLGMFHISNYTEINKNIKMCLKYRWMYLSVCRFVRDAICVSFQKF